jgi:hypothetical protein
MEQPQEMQDGMELNKTVKNLFERRPNMEQWQTWFAEKQVERTIDA